MKELEKTILNDWNAPKRYKLSEEFMHNNRFFLDWNAICRHQELSEEFMRKHDVYIDFPVVSEYQALSEPFIRDYKDRLNKVLLYRNTKIDKEILDKMYNC